MNKQKKALTLIELVVVLTILAILSTTAFISFRFYWSDARDTKRLETMANIEKTLESYYAKRWDYPMVSSWAKVFYNNWTNLLAWEQWSFWELTQRITEKMHKIPLDPLTNEQYTYSITNDKQEFQLAWILENNNLSFNFTNQANAWWEFEAKLKVLWNYNWKILKIQKTENINILAIPSIIHWKKWDQDLLDILNNKDLLFNNFKNLPASYSNTKYNIKPENLTLVNTWSLLLYSWKIQWLKDHTAQINFAINLRNAYSWTTIANQNPYLKIVKSVGNEEFIAQSILQKNVLPEIEVEAIDKGIN
jgi:prepilin-type N-terminal cleavage/methylation domain-containing protein